MKNIFNEFKAGENLHFPDKTKIVVNGKEVIIEAGDYKFELRDGIIVLIPGLNLAQQKSD